MKNENLTLQIEALIFASDRPISHLDIVTLLSAKDQEGPDGDTISECLQAIANKYASENFAFELKESGGGFQFLTKKKYHQTVQLLNGEKFRKKLSNAAMETLSIIAYKQPVTKTEIEAIRGVNSDYSVQGLLEKELVCISGRKEDAIGKPLLYSTTKNFMDYLGINSVADLPKIKEIQPTDTVTPNKATDALPADQTLQAEEA